MTWFGGGNSSSSSKSGKMMQDEQFNMLSAQIKDGFTAQAETMARLEKKIDDLQEDLGIVSRNASLSLSFLFIRGLFFYFVENSFVFLLLIRKFVDRGCERGHLIDSRQDPTYFAGKILFQMLEYVRVT